MKTRILCILMALFAVSNVSVAQHKNPRQSFGMRRATITCLSNIETIPNNFLPELNELPADKNLYVIKGEKTDWIEVAMIMDKQKADNEWEPLMKIDRGRKSPENLEDLSDAASVPNYSWVFVRKDFIRRCLLKNINIKFKEEECKEAYTAEEWEGLGTKKDEHISAKLKGTEFCCIANGELEKTISRLSQMLGIDTIAKHNWICTFKVKIEDLFRPAYQTKVDDIIKSDPENPRKVYNNKLDASNLQKKKIEGTEISLDEFWMAQLQEMNEYPWTRLGYTYDWGPENANGTEENIGVSEFVIRPEAKIIDIEVFELKEK